MATFITIKLEENLTKEQQDALRYLFSDALGEFKLHRWPAEEYLEKRYPGDKVLCDQAARDRKLASIKLRNELAELLHNPVLRLESSVVDSSDKQALVRRYIKAALNTELQAIIDMALIDLEVALYEEKHSKDKVDQFLVAIKETGGHLMAITEEACSDLFDEKELEIMTAFFESPAGKAVTGKAGDLGKVVDASIDIWRESISKRAQEVFPIPEKKPAPISSGDSTPWTAG